MHEPLTFALVRRGGHSWEPLDLTELPDTDPPSVRVVEDEPVELVLRCRDDVQPRLYLQDLELDRPLRQNLGDFFEFRWEPRPGGPVPFLNHFGYCLLTINYLVGPEEEVVCHASVEVFARKPNAERAERILDYLETRLEDVSRSCFSATPLAAPHSPTEAKEGDEIPASILLQSIANHLQVFAALLPRFRYRKRCRLAPTPRRIKAAHAANLTEQSVHWALTHLDTLLPVGAPTPGSIPVGGRFYELDEIETYALTEETNLYENQVIAGYLESIAARLSEFERFCLEQLRLVESEGFIAQVPPGYGSIFDIKRKIGRKRFGKLLSECAALQRNCADQVVFWHKHLPVARAVREMPEVTPGFLSSPHYHQVFRQIVAWHGLGRLNLAGERFLYGLRTIDRLYEFYCLFRLVETIKDAGWAATGQRAQAFAQRAQASAPRHGESLGGDARPDTVYTFRNGVGERITLFYEPEIEREPDTVLGLVRTMEGGTSFLPDFVLKFESATDEPPSYLILDAKYVSPYIALNFELTKITMKYLHGIGVPNGGHSPVKGIFVLHPQSFHAAVSGSPYHAYHARNFGLFSDTPAIPALAVVELTPGTGNEPDAGDAALLRVLQRALEVLRR